MSWTQAGPVEYSTLGTGILRQFSRLCRLYKLRSYNLGSGEPGGAVSAIFVEKGVENWSEREA